MVPERPNSRLQLDFLYGLAFDGFIPPPGIEANHDMGHPEKLAGLVFAPIRE
jgi:hypothetical protein